MTAREIITKRLNHEGTSVTPYNLFIEYELEQKIAAYYKDENWRTKKLRRFTTNSLWIDTQLFTPYDDIRQKDVYGAIWRMDKRPWHLETPPLDEPTLDGYDFPGEAAFVTPILERKAAAIEAYNADTEHYRIIDMGWGIFEHSWKLRGFENVLMDMITDEDFYAEMTTRITDNYIAMIKTCADVPADAFMFGDDWGDQRGVIMGPDRWRKFLKPCWARIYAEAKKQGKKTIQHSCGSIAEIYDDLIEIGLDCHESVQPEANGMAPEVLKEKWGKKMSFWGCLGSQGILCHGTPKEIETEIKRLHHLFKDDGGFVLSPAKPLMDEMHVDQAIAVIETLGELNES
ncbi:MAG: hypothetical protein FWC71_03400 [Defluviitaleaceae bacterium]|nr:hypothetical protein [Defluviitaleaceae bacterium]